MTVETIYHFHEQIIKGTNLLTTTSTNCIVAVFSDFILNNGKFTFHDGTPVIKFILQSFYLSRQNALTVYLQVINGH